MRLREHPAIADGKLDMFRADPRKLIVQDGYNVRDLTTADAVEKLRELSADIAENGVKSPLLIRFDGEHIILVEGHRRLAATLMAIEGGADIKSVPIYQEQRGVNDAERTLGLLISNSGEPLAPLETAEAVRRLVAFGWSHDEIRKRRGWKSTGTVKGYLDMLAMPEAVKEQVREGKISATLAKTLAKGCDPALAAELIQNNLDENKRIRGTAKRHKVTAKTIKRDVDKRKPPAGEEVAKHVELPPAAVLVSAPAPAPESGSIVADLASGLPATPKKTEQPHAHSLNGTAKLIEALKPFADLCNEFDVNARADDDLLEVFVRDVKRAWTAYTAATGGETGDAYG